ncbi:MAG: hypothetical protein QOG89_1231 [Thermomicrobiales bacterium]|jgi:hypothetical protein|nr:hypothetical protein [Thermomicrobiales bacterium]MEA2529587.1 hypothetical protein [Thermomicrobiales bacterium]
MALLYLDEGLSNITDKRLVRLGDDVLDARSVVRDGTSDHHHLSTATRLGRILVTHNRADFELLHLAWKDWFVEFAIPPHPKHGGIVIVPQPPVVSAEDVADLIHAFVNDESRGGLANRLFLWEIPSAWREILTSPPRSPRPNTARRPLPGGSAVS